MSQPEDCQEQEVLNISKTTEKVKEKLKGSLLNKNLMRKTS
jgi:hypothetical protein